MMSKKSWILSITLTASLTLAGSVFVAKADSTVVPLPSAPSTSSGGTAATWGTGCDPTQGYKTGTTKCVDNMEMITAYLQVNIISQNNDSGCAAPATANTQWPTSIPGTVPLPVTNTSPPPGAGYYHDADGNIWHAYMSPDNTQQFTVPVPNPLVNNRFTDPFIASNTCLYNSMFNSSPSSYTCPAWDGNSRQIDIENNQNQHANLMYQYFGKGGNYISTTSGPKSLAQLNPPNQNPCACATPPCSGCNYCGQVPTADPHPGPLPGPISGPSCPTYPEQNMGSWYFDYAVCPPGSITATDFSFDQQDNYYNKVHQCVCEFGPYGNYDVTNNPACASSNPDVYLTSVFRGEQTFIKYNPPAKYNSVTGAAVLGVKCLVPIQIYAPHSMIANRQAGQIPLPLTSEQQFKGGSTPNAWLSWSGTLPIITEFQPKSTLSTLQQLSIYTMNIIVFIQRAPNSVTAGPPPAPNAVNYTFYYQGYSFGVDPNLFLNFLVPGGKMPIKRVTYPGCSDFDGLGDRVFTDPGAIPGQLGYRGC
jgi:hypothetical protein